MGYVYLLCDPNQEYYKIGVTRGSIQNRIKKLQTGNGTHIHIVSYYKTEYPFKLEKLLHTKFAPKRVLNEWFDLDVNDITQFLSICESTEKDLIYLIENNPFM